MRGSGREVENEDRSTGTDGSPESASDAEAELAAGRW